MDSGFRRNDTERNLDPGIYAKMFHVKHRPEKPELSILQNDPMDRKIVFVFQ